MRPCRRSTSPPPPLSPSSTRVTTPPLSLVGLPTSRDNAAVSTRTLTPPRGDSTRQPLRDNSETHLLDLKNELSKAVRCAQASKTDEIIITDVKVEQTVIELLNEVYLHLPQRLQEQVIAHLNANILPQTQERNTLPIKLTYDEEKDSRKGKGISTKKLVGWTIEKIVLPVGLCFLMFLISLYVSEAEQRKGILRS